MQLYKHGYGRWRIVFMLWITPQTVIAPFENIAWPEPRCIATRLFYLHHSFFYLKCGELRQVAAKSRYIQWRNRRGGGGGRGRVPPYVFHREIVAEWKRGYRKKVKMEKKRRKIGREGEKCKLEGVIFLLRLWIYRHRNGIDRLCRAGPRGRARGRKILGVHPLSWLLSNNRLEKVPFVSVPHTSSNRLLLSNQDKGCTPSVAHSLALPLGPALHNLWTVSKDRRMGRV